MATYSWKNTDSLDLDGYSWDPSDDIDPWGLDEVLKFDEDLRDFLSPDRPFHSRKQVRTPRGIKVGMRLRMWNRNHYDVVIVKAAPYLRMGDDSESLSFDYVHEDHDFIHTTYLVDQGVTRYDFGEWNAVNWLERLK